MIKKALLLSLAGCSILYLDAAQVLTGNADNQQETFI